MKKIITIAITLMFTVRVFAQTPEKMSYQAVVRNSTNDLVTTQAVGMQISILQGSATGTAVYVETQMPTTNVNGLVSLELGAGTVVSGNFTTIDWANNTYFIKTETDPTGGTNYTITGTSQLMSVPYALHAKTAESITGTITETDPVFGASLASGITAADTVNWNNHIVDTQLDSVGVAALGFVAGPHTVYTAGANITITAGNVISATGGSSSNSFYLGQDTLGGIVYHLYIGSDGNQHGLIVNKAENMAVWQVGATIVNANRSWDGAYNTSLMTSSAAATYVNGLTDGGFTDWYLPSIDELSLLWHNRFYANKALNAGGSTLLSNTANYWSSTEYDASTAFTLFFTYGYASNFYLKTNSHIVRAIRAF